MCAVDDFTQSKTCNTRAKKKTTCPTDFIGGIISKWRQHEEYWLIMFAKKLRLALSIEDSTMKM
jgi:hypothetical protein